MPSILIARKRATKSGTARQTHTGTSYCHEATERKFKDSGRIWENSVQAGLIGRGDGFNGKLTVQRFRRTHGPTLLERNNGGILRGYEKSRSSYLGAANAPLMGRERRDK